MEKQHEELLTSLRPNFTEADIIGMKNYFDISYKYKEDLDNDMMPVLRKHPVFGPLIEAIPEETRLARDEQSKQLLYKGIFENNWDPYMDDLITQGVMYAKMGLEFSSWYEVIGIVKDYIMPYIVKEYKGSQDKINQTLLGMWKLFDYAMQGIAESYFIEKNKLIAAQQKKQERLISELESFAYVVSHDLKSPLRGISKISEWMIQDYGEKLGPEGKEQLELMRVRVRRLDHLIEDILEYSKIGRTEVNLKEVDVHEIINDVIELVDPTHEANINYKNGLKTIQFDETKLTQVFSNLLSNAIKYCDKDKCEVLISAEDRGNSWEIKVEDNGPGINKKYHDKVFGLFQTLEAKDDTDSTGIGLALVKKIVEDAGGNIWIESEASKGTAFIFTIIKN